MQVICWRNLSSVTAILSFYRTFLIIHMTRFINCRTHLHFKEQPIPVPGTFSSEGRWKVCCLMKVCWWCKWKWSTCSCDCVPRTVLCRSTTFQMAVTLKSVFPEWLEMLGNGKKFWAAGTFDPLPCTYRIYSCTISVDSGPLFSPRTLCPFVPSLLSPRCSSRVQPDLFQCCSPRSQ